MKERGGKKRERETEAEREICLEKAGGAREGKRERTIKREGGSNESKYNAKGYLIVSTLYLRPGRDYTATSLLLTVASFIRNSPSGSRSDYAFRECLLRSRVGRKEKRAPSSDALALRLL